jgi:hypothetical protein
MADLKPGYLRFVSVGEPWKARAEVWTGTEWIGMWGVKSTTFKRESDTLDEITLVAYCHLQRDGE